jgi:hypothetical protein
VTRPPAFLKAARRLLKPLVFLKAGRIFFVKADRLLAVGRFHCHLGSSLGFFWNIQTYGTLPVSPRRARHEFALMGCGVPLRLRLQIPFFCCGLLWF